MKKHVIIATGLAVLSSSAFATKARMEALGQGTGGSLYLEDTRKIFVNPAHLNNLKNYVVTEWGTQVSTGADTTAAPVAEGGFFREMGSFAYGLYVGNEANAQNSKRQGGAGYAGVGAMGETGLLTHDNALDLFFAGDMGVQWGARLHYARGAGETKGNTTATANFEQTHSAFGLGLGITMGSLDVYSNLDLSDKSEGGNLVGDKFEADLGLNAGVAYNFGGLTAFVDYAKVGAEYTNSATAKVSTTQSTISVGAARIHEISSTAVVVFDLRYAMISAEDKIATGKTELNTNALPLTVAFETDATSWLTLRGSISQNLPVLSGTETITTPTTGAKTETTATTANSTSVKAGATLSFGKLKVDGTIGTTDVSRAGTAANKGVLTLDNLMTRVGVHYWF